MLLLGEVVSHLAPILPALALPVPPDSLSPDNLLCLEEGFLLGWSWLVLVQSSAISNVCLAELLEVHCQPVLVEDLPILVHLQNLLFSRFFFMAMSVLISMGFKLKN